MARHEKPPSLIQLDLFRERPATPTWQQLPKDVRARAQPLLARLLRAHCSPRPEAAREQEVCDD